MNRSALRGFAAGIIVATGVLTLTYYIDRPAMPAASSMPEKQAVQSAAAGSQAQHAAGITPGQPAQQTAAKKPKPVYKVSLKVGQGTTPEDVAAKLEKAKVITDKKALIKYFINNRLMYALKRGTHNLNSNMTIGQIASNLIRP